MKNHLLTVSVPRLLPAALLALLLTASASARPAAALSYTITRLGISAQDINNNGQVVGSSGFGPVAVLRDPNGSIFPLGELPGGHYQSTAYAINDAGQVVGISDSSSGVEWFLWSQATGMIGLGVPGGFSESHVGDINNAGQVVGYSRSGLRNQGFLWSQATGMVGLGDLPRGEVFSRAYGINDAGQVVGQSWSGNGPEAFLRNPDGSMVGLGDLPGGGFRSYAYGINNTGQVVGFSVSSSGNEAFLWSRATGMVGLGDLPGGDFQSVARDINDAGQVVGISGSGSGYHAFLCSGGVMTDLNDLVAGSGWELWEARAINNKGQIIGYGIFRGDGRYEGGDVLLTPTASSVPEPTSLVLLGTGALGLCHRLRRLKQNG